MAPGPETSRRLSGVMSYMATAVRVFQASAAAMGELNIPDQASRAGDCHSSRHLLQQFRVGFEPVGAFPSAALQEESSQGLVAGVKRADSEVAGGSLDWSGCRTS